LDYYAGRPHDIIHKAGEKFLKTQLNMGTVKVIPGTEFIFTDFVKEHGDKDTAYHQLDSLAGTAFLGDGASSLSETAADPLTQGRYEVFAGTRNIVYPQAMPVGNRINQFNLRTATELRKIFNEEEKLWWLGRAAADGTQTARKVGAVNGDTDAVNGLPFSVEGYFTSNGTTFAGMDPVTAGFGDWGPVLNEDATAFQVSSQADMLAELRTIQKNINLCGYSEDEHVTHGWTTKDAFEGIIDAMVSKGALPDPVRANLGNSWDYQIPFGGINIQWSRYLEGAVEYDRDGAGGGVGVTLVHPFYGLNMKNIHYNITTESAMMTSEGMPGWIAQAGPLIPIVGKTNLFKRIWFSRTRSVVGGRRSSFAMYRWLA
jgi:hypothetical protein